MTAPFGVILAGGQAVRMGGVDKALLDLGGRPMLAQVIDRLAPQVAAMALNANGDATRFAGFGLPVIPDTMAGFPGPLAGVLAGLDWAAAQGGRHIVTVAADTPFFPADLVARLMAERVDAPIALAETASGLHPTFGLWSVALRDDLALALASGARKVAAWAQEKGRRRVRFEEDPCDPFFNVNTPDDLARVRARIAGGEV